VPVVYEWLWVRVPLPPPAWGSYFGSPPFLVATLRRGIALGDSSASRDALRPYSGGGVDGAFLVREPISCPLVFSYDVATAAEIRSS